jgi:hypothetical protein
MIVEFLIRGKAMRTLLILVAAFLLDACAAQPHGPTLGNMSQGIRTFLVARQDGAAYAAGPNQIRVAQLKTMVEPTQARGNQSVVHSPAPPLSFVAESKTRVPTLNVEASCRMSETLGTGQNASTCLSMEGSARDQLVANGQSFQALNACCA